MKNEKRQMERQTDNERRKQRDKKANRQWKTKEERWKDEHTMKTKEE